MSAKDLPEPLDENEQAFEAALKNLPDRTPRPEGELEELERVWAKPKGWRTLTVVNNDYVGSWYVGASLMFFVLAGILALIMRVQLAAPLADIVGPETYNQLFTMHGTIMMFLFAVPAVEAMGVLLLPQMFAARDLPFPRLSAFAFWAYFIGGTAFFLSLFWGVAPDGGWFMNPPYTSYIFSPGVNADFWLLGIGFIEISAIAGAIEIVVGCLKTRAPGMTLDKLPIFGWAMLVFAGMIIVGFPAIILGTILLELERAFHWPFFIAEAGGDPLLWQHLFWFFGHPEVYIIFLPAAGLVSMMIPTIARAKLVGYNLVVLALVATGFISFGVWAHHMFTTGIPDLSLSFFSAASMAVSIPAGVQVFAWIATLMLARKIRFNVPTLFVFGFLVIFTMGGLTGVMLGLVPFDWQAHDTYFIVAHLHYVLIGGMVFPLFAAIYYWTPMVSQNALSERLGKWAFWLMFSGTHITFFIMHYTGLQGMPRRVYTYLPAQDVSSVNLISTVGAFTIAAGVAVFVFDMLRNFRLGGENAGNVYDGGTLEWLPQGDYCARSIPVVDSTQPLWDRPELASEVKAGQWFLPGALTGRRETIVTSPIKAIPQYLVIIPGPSIWHVLAAIGTAGFFLSLTVKLVWVAAAFGILGIGAVLRWMSEMDKGPDHPPVDVGGGMMLPVYMTGPKSHAIWAMWVLVIVFGMIFACQIFSYLFLWSGQPEAWPPAGTGAAATIPAVLSIAAYAGSFLLMIAAGRALSRVPEQAPGRFLMLLLTAIAALLAGFGGEFAAYGHIDPTASGFGATSWTFTVLNGLQVATLFLWGAFLVWRTRRGMTDGVRRLSFDCILVLWGFAAAQASISLTISAFFPLLI